MVENPPKSGIYRCSFRTDKSETNDDNDVIRTFNGALLQLRSDIDGDGIEGSTDILNVTIDDQPPTPPRWCDSNATSWGSVKVNWTEYKGEDFRRYTVVRSLSEDFSDAEDAVNITESKTLQWFDGESNLISGVKYWYGIQVVDLAGNPSVVRSAETYVTPFNDTTPPASVTGLGGSAPEEGNSINLTWSPSPERDVVGYNVYHSTETSVPTTNENLIGFIAGTNFLHEDISANYVHFYVIVAFDEEENPSPSSDVFNATPDDTIPPLAPMSFAISTDATGYLNLSWSAPYGEEIYRYNIYRSEESRGQQFWNPYISTKDTSYLDENVEHGKIYFYVVRSSDKAGNEEESMFEVAATSIDSTPPMSPRGLKAEDTEIGSRIKLVWLPPGGEKPAAYQVFRSNVSGGQNFSSPLAVLSKTYFTDRGVQDGVNYYYVVRSVDAAGNIETNTNELRVMSRDLTPPPPVLEVVAGARKGGVIGIGWLPPGSNVEDLDLAKQMRADVDHYNVYWNIYDGFKPDPSKMISTTDTSTIHSDLIDGQAYYYIVRSVDAAGNENMDDDKTSVSAVADTSPPGKPTNLKTFRLADGRIGIDWGAPFGEAPYRYNIYRSTAPDSQSFTFPFAMSFKETEWVDDNVTHGQWYYYIVRSTDFLLNEDQNTIEVGNFSDDRTPPSPPTGLMITKLARGDLMINWTEPVVESIPPYGPRYADMAVLYRLYCSTTSGGHNFTRPIAEIDQTYFIDRGLRDKVDYYYVVRSVDAAGNEDRNRFEMRGTADASPPPPPIDVIAQRSPKGEIIISWSDPEGEQVFEYRIYKFIDEEEQDFTEPLVVTKKNTYVDNDVSEAVQYRYVIRSVDKADNEGQNTIETLAPVLLGAPQNLEAHPGRNGIIELTWDPPTDGKDAVKEYNIYRSTVPGVDQLGKPWATIVVTRYIDTTRMVGGATQYMVEGTRYYYYIRAVDLYDNEGIKSTEVSAVSDSQPPEKPLNLKAVAVDTGDITLYWNTPGGERVASYRVYRSTKEGVFNFIIPLDEVSRIIYHDENVVSGTTYYYVVRSVDEAGNEEQNTEKVHERAFDAPPLPPRSLRAKLRPNGSIVLTWSPPTGEAISYYNIYRSLEPGSYDFNEPYARTTISMFTDNFVEHGHTYYYIIRAVDSTGNEETNENEISKMSLDTEPPGSPVDLMAMAWGTGRIRLQWDSPEGDSPASYLIYRSESPYFNPSSQSYLNQTAGNSFVDSKLGDSRTYHYIVRSVDIIGNDDDNTNRVSATTPPAPPTRFEATQKETGEILLLWEIPTTPVSNFRIYRALQSTQYNFSEPLAKVPYPLTSYVDSGLNHSVTYYYLIRSVDSLGAEETNTNEILAISMETVPPQPPTNLQTTQMPSGGIRLEWDHLDMGDISTFKVLRSEGAPSLSSAILLVSTNRTYFEDVDLVSGKTYSYLVRAVDIHDNEESNQNWRSMMSLDTLPPGSPMNLTAKALSGGSIELVWNMPREKNLTFNIYRATSSDPANITLIASTNLTTYLDEKLVNGREYFYAVRTQDSAGNEDKNKYMVSAVASKSGPRILLALGVIGVFIIGGYVVDKRRRAAEAASEQHR